VVVTGEIFCALDPFANFDIETRLGRLGARPHRVIWQTSHIRYYLRLDLFQPDGKRAAIKAARELLPEQLGGDCNANVGHAVLAARRGDDGMVHLKPFGCMLEFVAQNLLNAVERETGLPILSLTLDDLTGEERINVRLEAFVDNLFRRRRNGAGRRRQGAS
jgi:predicted nucleotide-binding protein (sugar kinase/HSP70/actin superfamily)